MHRCVPVQGMKMPHPKDLAQTKISALRLPKGMKDWQFVVRQRLANPRILGEIPPPFGQMLELFVMDLAHNNLQGRIPAELGQLQKWRGCSKTKQKPMSWPVHFCMSCAVVAVQVRVYAQWFWLYSWIDCFATNFKFRGGPIVHTNGKTWVEGEKAVLALVCPGYSESVSLSDCWFQFNSSPTWLLCFGDAAAKQELHDTRDIGIPVLTSILVKASDAEPCLINAWEIKLMHWPNDRGGRNKMPCHCRRRLATLDLCDNQLSGGIPPEIGQLAHLLNLGLSYNRLSGEIPVQFKQLAALDSRQRFDSRDKI